MAKVEILRPGDEGEAPELLLRNQVEGSVTRIFSRSLSPLPQLLEGDLIVITFRLKRLTSVAPDEVAFVETFLEAD